MRLKKTHLKLTYGLGICGYHAMEDHLTQYPANVTCKWCMKEGKLKLAHAYKPIGTGDCWVCGKPAYQHPQEVARVGG